MSARVRLHASAPPRPACRPQRRPAAWLLAPAFALALLATLACATPRPEATTGRAPVDGTSLYYEIRGRGPTVVLLQGGQLPLEMWDPQFSELARDFRVIRYDARGFGRSGPKTGPFAYHEDLYALLRHLKVERASLVGLSLGGRVAVDFALEHPAMVQSLVLAGPGLSGYRFSEAREPWTDSAIAAARARDSVRVALLWLESGYMRPAMRDPVLASRLRELSARNASLWMQSSNERPLDPPAIGRLAAVRAPTLVMLGSEDVQDIHQIVDTLVARIPGARRVVIPGAGHMINMERPVEFNRFVLDFLRGAGRPAAE